MMNMDNPYRFMGKLEHWIIWMLGDLADILLFSPMLLGMSSSNLTWTPSFFQGGRSTRSTTNQLFICHGDPSDPWLGIGGTPMTTTMTTPPLFRGQKDEPKVWPWGPVESFFQRPESFKGAKALALKGTLNIGVDELDLNGLWWYI